MTRNRLLPNPAAVALALATSTALHVLPAGAGEGAIEINQLCVATGCFAGDAPGWPVQLTEPGSYVLTSNLDVPSSSEGVEIQASQVVLDLGEVESLNPLSGFTELLVNHRQLFDILFNFLADLLAELG